MKNRDTISIIIMRSDKILHLLVLLFLPLIMGIARLEDLDKSPVGAYKGQILFGANVAFGFPFGPAIAAEEDFAEGCIYTFPEAEVTKTLALNHFMSSMTVFSEYVFRDHFGARFMLSKNTVVQRSAFGKDLSNENRVLYDDIALCLAPVYHLTVRQNYDLALAPFAGVSFGKFTRAPVMSALFEEMEEKTTSQSVFVYGLDISGIYYFNGGFFINAGLNFSMKGLKTESCTRLKPAPEATYNSGSKDVFLNTLVFYIGGGYALYN